MSQMEMKTATEIVHHWTEGSYVANTMAGAAAML